LLVQPGRTVLVSDFRYAVQAEQEAGGAAVIAIDRTSVWERLRRVLQQDPPEALAIEAHAVTVQEAGRISEHVKGRVVPAVDIVERLRVSKGPEEVAAIRVAAELAQAA